MKKKRLNNANKGEKIQMGVLKKSDQLPFALK